MPWALLLVPMWQKRKHIYFLSSRNLIFLTLWNNVTQENLKQTVDVYTDKQFFSQMLYFFFADASPRCSWKAPSLHLPSCFLHWRLIPKQSQKNRCYKENVCWTGLSDVFLQKLPASKLQRLICFKHTFPGKYMETKFSNTSTLLVKRDLFLLSCLFSCWSTHPSHHSLHSRYVLMFGCLFCTVCFTVLLAQPSIFFWCKFTFLTVSISHNATKTKNLLFIEKKSCFCLTFQCLYAHKKLCYHLTQTLALFFILPTKPHFVERVHTYPRLNPKPPLQIFSSLPFIYFFCGGGGLIWFWCPVLQCCFVAWR